jgi:hypothetical protein
VLLVVKKFSLYSNVVAPIDANTYIYCDFISQQPAHVHMFLFSYPFIPFLDVYTMLLTLTLFLMFPVVISASVFCSITLRFTSFFQEFAQ